MTIRIVAADDQAVARAGFRTIPETEPDIEVVGETSDGATAVATGRRHRPDVVLMDVRMPGTDGIAATRQLAGAAVADPVPAVRVVAPNVTRRLIAEFASLSPTRAKRTSALPCSPTNTARSDPAADRPQRTTQEPVHWPIGKPRARRCELAVS